MPQRRLEGSLLMPLGVIGEKRSSDVICNSVKVMQISSGSKTDSLPSVWFLASPAAAIYSPPIEDKA